MIPEEVTIVLLASGLSHRYENGDKLLADLDSSKVLEQTAQTLESVNAKNYIAVIGEAQPERRACLTQKSWNIVSNPYPERGQGSSIAIGVRAAIKTKASSILIALADMPLIPLNHYVDLISSLTEKDQAVFTSSISPSSKETLSPPAVFSKHTVQYLLELTGDQGAKSALPKRVKSANISLPASLATDIDTVDDLRRARQTLASI